MSLYINKESGALVGAFQNTEHESASMVIECGGIMGLKMAPLLVERIPLNHWVVIENERPRKLTPEEFAAQYEERPGAMQ